ncbi:Magnesium transporter MRS2-5 [Acorus calamus]|uniref:Magnesium transporter MRS2-5 n=1 Tax=Acorus calamus TaxID=4465 RepID=A0AAV9ERJ7_ACOCL|nr:Magnesium transporter MRS2-5 [Acorus calamus]
MYESELCRRLQTIKDQNDNLPFEFRALELALEMTCMSLDAQVTELEVEVYPVLDELATSVSTVNLEQVRRLKTSLLALTRRVQKVRDEIEHLMDDDGDMQEMYLTEKKERMEAYSHRNSSRLSNLSKQGSSRGSSGSGIEELEMLLEAYFVVIDNTLSKLLSLKDYIDDTEDFINIKLDNVQNQLIQFEMLLTAATSVVTIFAVVSGVFGMNFVDSVFDRASNFDSVVIGSGIACCVVYLCFLLSMSTKGSSSMRSKVERRMRRETGKTQREIRRAKKLRKKLMTDEERLIYSLRRAKKKAALLLQKLKKYELPELPAPRHDPELLTPEQLQAYKKIGYRNKNYVPVGVRGVFGGVVQNMHLHWKFHETVQVCCDNFPKEKIKEMASMLTRLSGGIVVNIHDVKTIIMFRGRNYRQPKILIPINTLTKRKALFKARFEQALESQKLNIKKIEQQLRRMGMNPEDPVAMASIRRESIKNEEDNEEVIGTVLASDDSDQEELDRFIAGIEDAADQEFAAEEAAEKEEVGRIRYWNKDDMGPWSSKSSAWNRPDTSEGAMGRQIRDRRTQGDDVHSDFNSDHRNSRQAHGGRLRMSREASADSEWEMGNAVSDADNDGESFDSSRDGSSKASDIDADDEWDPENTRDPEFDMDCDDENFQLSDDEPLNKSRRVNSEEEFNEDACDGFDDYRSSGDEESRFKSDGMNYQSEASEEKKKKKKTDEAWDSD